MPCCLSPLTLMMIIKSLKIYSSRLVVLVLILWILTKKSSRQRLHPDHEPVKIFPLSLRDAVLVLTSENVNRRSYYVRMSTSEQKTKDSP